jgi:ribosomal protein S18 acetylase RimI-like enzyme
MIEFKPLECLDADAWAILQAGYISTTRYVVSKTETPELTTIKLELVPFAQPYIKHWDYDAEDLVRYTALLANGFSCGAYDGRQLVGVALAQPHTWNRVLWVEEFHVAESRRGQGIGHEMMEHLARKAQAANLRALVCEVQNTNTRAIHFYRQTGFTLESVDLSYYTNDDAADDEVAIFMKKKLKDDAALAS